MIRAGRKRTIADVQLGLALAGDRAHLRHRVVCVFQNGARFLEKSAAGFGQADRLRSALQQLDAEFLFEIANLAA